MYDFFMVIIFGCFFFIIFLFSSHLQVIMVVFNDLIIQLLMVKLLFMPCMSWFLVVETLGFQCFQLPKLMSKRFSIHSPSFYYNSKVTKVFIFLLLFLLFYLRPSITQKKIMENNLCSKKSPRFFCSLFILFFVVWLLL